MADTDNPKARLGELRARWESEPRSRVFLQLAEEYRRQGQPLEAMAVLDEGLGRHPSSVAGQVLLGRCRLESGQLEAAAATLEEVVRRDPTHLVAYRWLTETYLQLGDPERARDRLELYAQLNPQGEDVPELSRRLVALESSPPASASPGPSMEPEAGAASAEAGLYEATQPVTGPDSWATEAPTVVGLPLPATEQPTVVLVREQLTAPPGEQPAGERAEAPGEPGAPGAEERPTRTEDETETLSISELPTAAHRVAWPEPAEAGEREAAGSPAPAGDLGAGQLGTGDGGSALEAARLDPEAPTQHIRLDAVPALGQAAGPTDRADEGPPTLSPFETQETEVAVTAPARLEEAAAASETTPETTAGPGFPGAADQELGQEVAEHEVAGHENAAELAAEAPDAEAGWSAAGATEPEAPRSEGSEPGMPEAERPEEVPEPEVPEREGSLAGAIVAAGLADAQTLEHQTLEHQTLEHQTLEHQTLEQPALGAGAGETLLGAGSTARPAMHEPAARPALAFPRESADAIVFALDPDALFDRIDLAAIPTRPLGLPLWLTGAQRPARPGTPDAEQVTSTLASLYLDQGHAEEAARLYGDVLAREPENRAARDGLEQAEVVRRELNAKTLLGDYQPDRGGLSAKQIYVLQRYLSRLRDQDLRDVP
jgi:hypothetical protein